MLCAPSKESGRSSLPSQTLQAASRSLSASPQESAPPAGYSQRISNLQRIVGNQAILRTISRSQQAIQTKLAVNQPGDVYEQEADRVADQVMRMTAPVAVQRQCAACAQEDKLQRKCAECAEEDTKELHRKETGAGPRTAPPIVHQVLNSPGQPLDSASRTFMEPRFGYDFSSVRVHADSRATESAQAVHALAYTVGRNIVFARDQYSPGSAASNRLLAHELTHVVQQDSQVQPLSRSLVGSPGDTLHAPHAAARVLARTTDRLQRQTPSAPNPPCPLPSDFPDDRSAQMDMLCITNSSTNPSCTLTDRHLQLLTTAQTEARSRVQRAHFRMFAVGGPEFAARIGTRVFTDGPPPKTAIVRVLEAVERILLGQMSFAGGTCADPGCESGNQHAAAYESGPGNPVVFCPRSFLPSFLPELRRSVLHEAVHLSGIDIDPNVTERYCMAFTCDRVCQSTASADAWTLFIDCIGGPLP